MNERQKLTKVIEALESTGGYGSLLLRRRSGLTAQVSKQEESVGDTPMEYGAVLRLFDGETFHERGIDSHDPDRLRAQAKELARRTNIKPGRIIDPGPETERSFTTKVKTDPSGLSPKDLLDLARSYASDVLQTGPLLLNFSTLVRTATEEMTFINRTKFLHQRVYRTLSYLVMYVNKDGDTRDYFDSKGVTGDISDITWNKSEINRHYETAASLIGTRPPAPGRYTIGGSAHLSGLLAHEGFGHNAEIDMMVKDRSKAQDFLGKRVASKLVTIVDDPTIAGGYGGYFFDDDGTLAGPTTILDRGIFKTGLSDQSSALILNQPVTANARRESYQRKSYARMSNTFFTPGESSVGDIVASIDDGLYLDRFQSGMEDPKGWGIQIKFTIGREIKNGRLTGKIFSPVGLTGYVPEILGNISMVGDDFSLQAGGCGKGHKEFVPNGTGGVSIKTEAYLG